MASRNMSDEERITNVRVSNPHWAGDNCAWDITLSNGKTHYGVTRRDIGAALQSLLARNLIHLFDSHIDCVRRIHILHYDVWHTREAAK